MVNTKGNVGLPGRTEFVIMTTNFDWFHLETDVNFKAVIARSIIPFPVILVPFITCEPGLMATLYEAEYTFISRRGYQAVRMAPNRLLWENGGYMNTCIMYISGINIEGRYHIVHDCSHKSLKINIKLCTYLHFSMAGFMLALSICGWYLI